MIHSVHCKFYLFNQFKSPGFVGFKKNIIVLLKITNDVFLTGDCHGYSKTNIKNMRIYVKWVTLCVQVYIYTNMSPISVQYMNEYGISSCECMNG